MRGWEFPTKLACHPLRSGNVDIKKVRASNEVLEK